MLNSQLNFLKARPQVEALEDRSVPAFLVSDPVGDFLSTYTGPQDPGLDVVTHETIFLEDEQRVVFSGEMAGPIPASGLYIIGVDRGQGTPRFLNAPQAPPALSANVLWDAIVRVGGNGTGLVNNQLIGVTTALDPADISINGNEFTASVPLSLLMPSATRPPEEWTYNLWPRSAAGSNAFVSDLAPDDGNSPVVVVPAAQIASVVVNDGSAQRSMVNSLTVTFDSSVTIGTGAFELARSDGSLVEVNVATSVVNGQTVAVLTFAGSDVVGGSLADGSYTLTIRGNQIHDRYGRELDGDADGSAGGDRTDAVARRFGDSDGDGDVDLRDLGRFLSTLGRRAGDANYLWYLDVNSDNLVGVTDLVAFARRFDAF